MILQALVRYYEILAADERSKIPRQGYGTKGINFALELSYSGEPLEIHPQIDGTNPNKARQIIVPEQPRRSGNKPVPYFLCDKSSYVLGLVGKDTKDNKEAEAIQKFTQKCFEAFRKFNIELLSKANCDEAKAVITFLENYDPSRKEENPIIARNLESIAKKGEAIFTFMVDGNFVHKNAEIRRVWNEYYNRPKAKDHLGQCLVTGEKDVPIERLHSIAIKGIPPNRGGVAMVSFDDDAFNSHNKSRGFNAPVSKKAVFMYSTALNYLLSSENENKQITIGDTTIVYWAESQNNTYASVVSDLLSVKDEEAEQHLKDIAQKVKRGEKLDSSKEMGDGFDESTRFYILGLESPNRGRASIRFFHVDPFQKVVEKIASHYEDMEIIGKDHEKSYPIAIWKIVKETMRQKDSSKEGESKKDKTKKDKTKKDKTKNQFHHLSGEVLRSVLENAPYPAALYNGILNRLRADQDLNNYIRAAIIKAYLKRKYPHNQFQDRIQEALTMSLNKQSTYPPYVLGRLFAVLEDAQKQAAKPAKLDSTIKDRYFSSACASPANVFPVLLRLSQHHISKAEKGRHIDSRIQDILDLLEFDKTPIPTYLSLDDQGVFVLGYYHQRADFYPPKADANSAESALSEN
ncbi:MAG: type I-C CRISPR-associated protein Cas8c/Csd1 [Anaerolineales bacterium]|nr:type I-C CRISPR-associated protein Cas8c/Csd1 [Anaerolineales bacterium]